MLVGSKSHAWVPELVDYRTTSDTVFYRVAHFLAHRYLEVGPDGRYLEFTPGWSTTRPEEYATLQWILVHGLPILAAPAYDKVEVCTTCLQ